MTHPLLVDTPDPQMLRMLAQALDEQRTMPEQERRIEEGLCRLEQQLQSSVVALEQAMIDHQKILDELQLAAEELMGAFDQEIHKQTVGGEFVIDNVIVQIEVEFEVLTRMGNPIRAINSIVLKRGNERVDIVSMNSNTLIVYEDRELIMDLAIRTLEGNTAEDALRFVMTAVERWTLEHRHDNHYDLVIKLLLKCQVIVHPEEKVIQETPPVEPVAEEPKPIATRAPHTRTYTPHGTTFWREGFYRTSRNGVRHWVTGHWITR
jgi:hypothetical protein